jgi:hypothetical protein
MLFSGAFSPWICVDDTAYLTYDKMIEYATTSSVPGMLGPCGQDLVINKRDSTFARQTY